MVLARPLFEALRRFIAALYVLTLVLPVSVDAGIHLSPTPEFALAQDLASARCLDGTDGRDQPAHHDMSSCCVLCAPMALAALEGETETADFPRVATTFASAEQTAGLRLGIASQPPHLRGPPQAL